MSKSGATPSEFGMQVELLGVKFSNPDLDL